MYAFSYFGHQIELDTIHITYVCVYNSQFNILKPWHGINHKRYTNYKNSIRRKNVV